MNYGVASLTMPGESECGDGHLVREYPGGMLVSVVDGLGHGPEAAVAARAAIETLEASAPEGLTALVQRCHQRLRSTRGVVLSIASLDFRQGTLTWLGVGNVVGLLIEDGPGQNYEKTFLVSRNGLVGQNLPALRPVTMPIRPGDTLIFATDGVRERFPHEIDPTAAPQQMAEQILRDHALKTDDALVLVARCMGGAGES